MFPLIAIAVIGGLYLYSKDNQKSTLVPNASPSQQPQPNQRYPFMPPPEQRVDNKNQPWAVQKMNIVRSADSRTPGSAAAQSFSDIGAGLNIVNQSAQIWDNLDLGGWFTSGGETSPQVVAMDSVETYPAVDYNGSEYDFGSIYGGYV